MLRVTSNAPVRLDHEHKYAHEARPCRVGGGQRQHGQQSLGAVLQHGSIHMFRHRRRGLHSAVQEVSLDVGATNKTVGRLTARFQVEQAVRDGVVVLEEGVCVLAHHSPNLVEVEFDKRVVEVPL